MYCKKNTSFTSRTHLFSGNLLQHLPEKSWRCLKLGRGNAKIKRGSCQRRCFVFGFFAGRKRNQLLETICHALLVDLTSRFLSLEFQSFQWPTDKSRFVWYIKMNGPVFSFLIFDNETKNARQVFFTEKSLGGFVVFVGHIPSRCPIRSTARPLWISCLTALASQWQGSQGVVRVIQNRFPWLGWNLQAKMTWFHPLRMDVSRFNSH